MVAKLQNVFETIANRKKKCLFLSGWGSRLRTIRVVFAPHSFRDFNVVVFRLHCNRATIPMYSEVIRKTSVGY